MKIQYCSDLHIDMGHQPYWKDNNPIVPKADILILAGDIYRASMTPQHEFFDWLSKNFKKVYWVPGNHEFYNGVDVKNFFKDFVHPIKKNIFFVNNIFIKEDDVDIFFSTLWTKLVGWQAVAVQNGLNDFRLIKVDKALLNIESYNHLHEYSLNWLKNAVKKSKAEKKLIVTHHCPSRLCNHPDYVGSSINSGFVVDLTNYIDINCDADYWIYGHTHKNMPETKIGKTKLVTNQYGYHFAGEGNDYKTDAIIEL